MTKKKLLQYLFFSVFSVIVLVCTPLIGFCQIDTWERKESFGGSGRALPVGFAVGAKAYVGTGYDGSTTKDFWAYDPANNTWAQIADFGGGPRNAAVGFAIGDKGYVGTGSTNAGDNETKDFWAYSPAANTWTRKADFPGPGRLVAIGFSIGTKGYIGPGRSAGYSLFADFWEYDPLTDAWTQRADFGGGARYATSGFAIGNKAYIGTGTDFTGGGYTYRSDLWEFNQATNNWNRKADFGGGPRELAAGFSIHNKGYIGTGLWTSDFWEYDNVVDSWTRKADFGGGGRNQGLGLAVGGKGYIGLGLIFHASNDWWAYSPAPPLPSIACTNNNSTLYFGYTGDQTATITGTPGGGTPPYSVSITMNRPLKCHVINSSGNEIWVGGVGTTTTANTTCPASGANPVSTSNVVNQGGSYSVNVTLMANATFTITTTDALGYISSCTTNVSAQDVRCFAGNSNNSKTTVCHQTGNPNNPCVTICVDEAAIRAHLDHGDFLGKCNANCEAPPPSAIGATTSHQEIAKIETALKMQVAALPMPSRSTFAIKIESSDTKSKMEIKIVDVAGKLVEKITKVYPGQNLQIGSNYKPGVYILELTQGINRKQIKLVKL